MYHLCILSCVFIIFPIFYYPVTYYQAMRHHYTIFLHTGSISPLKSAINLHFIFIEIDIVSHKLFLITALLSHFKSRPKLDSPFYFPFFSTFFAPFVSDYSTEKIINAENFFSACVAYISHITFLSFFRSSVLQKKGVKKLLSRFLYCSCF